MVLTDSHGISRAPCYLGYSSRQERHFDYGVRTLYDQPFKAVRLYLLVTPAARQSSLKSPTTPNTQLLPDITRTRFSLFRFRSPLLTESRLLSLPVGTEMFHFPTFPPTTLCVQVEVAGHYSGFFRGFPIRRSPDRSSFTSSPGLIAGYNVLRRLLVPRHPPTALSSLLLLQRCSRPL